MSENDVGQCVDVGDIDLAVAVDITGRLNRTRQYHVQDGVDISNAHLAVAVDVAGYHHNILDIDDSREAGPQLVTDVVVAGEGRDRHGHCTIVALIKAVDPGKQWRQLRFHDELRQRGAVAEGKAVDMVHRLPHGHLLQITAAIERRLTDADHTVAQRRLTQGPAIGKGCIADFAALAVEIINIDIRIIVDGQICQSVARDESAVANGLHAAGYRQPLE